MLPSLHRKSPLQYAIFWILIGLLTACGGGSNGGSSEANMATSIAISGSVGDGPITGASITIMDAYGDVIATTISDETANYEAVIPEDATFPLIIVATGGTDMVSGTTPDFEMVSLLTNSAERNANINPFSTLIVKTAQAMPEGLNPTNIELATQIVVKHVNFGLDTALVPNPITTTIDERNVATIVKSSEVLAEMLRRARKSLVTSGSTLSEDDIIDALASDLTDGIVDGTGHQEADSRVAAVVNVVSGQVLVEALNNTLKVNGAPATTLMDNAILITEPEATETTNDAKFTREVIDQTKIAISSALTIDPSAPITDIPPILDMIQPGSTPEAVASQLPVDKSSDLEEAVTMVAYTPDSKQNELNTNVRNEIATTQPPVVSLTTDAQSISENGQFRLAWASRNATSCEASGPVDWNLAGSTSGEETINNLASSGTFSLTCTNDSGLTTTKSVSISVTASEDQITNEGSAAPATSTAGGAIPGSSNTTSGNPVNSLSGTQTPTTAPANPSSSDVSKLTSNLPITLNWNPTPGAVVGYIVYFGMTPDDTTTQFLDIPVNSTNFDPLAPNLEIDPVNDLSLGSGDNACFAISAYNNDGVSSPSPAVCSII